MIYSGPGTKAFLISKIDISMSVIMNITAPKLNGSYLQVIYEL